MSPELERAGHACNVCRARKKGCDKALPICGYCGTRDLPCKYDWTGTWSSATASPKISTIFSPLLFHGGSHTERVDETLHNCVVNVHRWTGLSLRDTLARYFHGTYHWLPVVKSNQLFRGIDELETESVPQSPEFNLLLLTIALLATPSTELATNTAASSSNVDLYLTVKTTLTHLHAVNGTSILLAQVALLVSARELAMGQPETASVSIGTCTRMISLLQWDTTNSTNKFNFHSEVPEEDSVYLGAAMVERIILSLLKPKFQRPMLELPCTTLAQLTLGSADPLIHSHSAENTNTVFRDQVVAAQFLEQVCQFINNSLHGKLELEEVKRLDRKAWKLLSRSVGDCRPMHTSCGHLATLTRIIFMLHLHNLSQPSPSSVSPMQPISSNRIQSPPPEAAMQESKAQSVVALDAAIRIMVETSLNHLQHVPVDRLPFCGAYNLRLALVYLTEFAVDNARDDRTKQTDILREFESSYLARWGRVFI